MSNREMLSEFIGDEFFNQTITLITRTVTRFQGRAVPDADVETPIDGVIQSVTAKTLINLGLGQYTDHQAFSLHTQTPIDQSENNFVRYEGKLYKIQKTSPWNAYGFNKYVLFQYNEEELNDN
jgi:hypothetical protein